MFKEHKSKQRPSRHAGGEHSKGRRQFGGGSRHGFGRGDFPAGRKLSSGELQLVLLALLEIQPAHGYELIDLCVFYMKSPDIRSMYHDRKENFCHIRLKKIFG